MPRKENVIFFYKKTKPKSNLSVWIFSLNLFFLQSADYQILSCGLSKKIKKSIFEGNEIEE